MKVRPLRFQAAPARWRTALLGHGHKGAASYAAAGLLAGCFAFLGWTIWTLVDTHHEVQEVRSGLSRAEARQSATARQAASTTRISSEQTRAWSDLASKLNTPWGRIFDTLEEGASGDVALVSIEPQAASRAVRVQAEAMDLAMLLAYAERLAGQKHVGEVLLVKHDVNEKEKERPVRLTLDIRWSEGGARR